MKRTKIAIERDPITRTVSICISGWWKWVAGIFASVLLAALTGGTSALWAIAMGQASMARDIHAIEEKVDDNSRALERLDDKIERVREDPFTGQDGKDLEDRLRREFAR